MDLQQGGMVVSNASTVVVQEAKALERWDIVETNLQARL